jgi:hypothetical protein
MLGEFCTQHLSARLESFSDSHGIDSVRSEIWVKILSSRLTSHHGKQCEWDGGGVSTLIGRAGVIFHKEDGVLGLSSPHVVVGGIHGNIDVLLRLFEDRGYTAETSSVFLSDCVDRGLTQKTNVTGVITAHERCREGFN